MEIKKYEVGVAMRREFFPKVRSVDEKKRTITFVASDESVDRYGDVIRCAGWQYQAYLRNPVFLWGHRSGDPPIGKCVDLHIESKPPALVQTIEFADAATYPFAETIFRLYQGGFLNAVSVGFMPLEAPVPMKDADEHMTGYEFNSQELLELSSVSCPANRNALARAVGSGVVTEDDVKMLFKCGETNPAWSYLAPGVTYAVPSNEKKENAVALKDEIKLTPRQTMEGPGEPAEPAEDEKPGSSADLVEELSEMLDECAADMADMQKICSSLADQIEPANPGGSDAIKPSVTKDKHASAPNESVSGILARVVESRNRLDSLSISVARQSDVTDATARINELRVIVEKQVGIISGLVETGVTKTELADIVTRFDEIRGRFDKLIAAVAKESVQADTVTRIDEVRVRVDKIASSAVKKSDFTDVAAKIDGVRSVIDNLSEVSVRQVQVADAIARTEEVRTRVESLLNVAAKESSLASVVSGQNEIRERFDNLIETTAKESSVADAVSGIGEVRTRLDALTANVVTKPEACEAIDTLSKKIDELVDITSSAFEALAKLVQEQAGKAPAAEKTVCPYTDDPIAPKGTAWDASAEMAKQTTSAGWKHMSTVIAGDSKLKGSYKLPHHTGNGFKVVPNGVRAALGRLEQTQMDSADRAGARAHLVKHEKKIQAQAGIDFDDSAFETKLTQLGDAYRAAEVAGLTAFVESINKEIEAHVALLDPETKPEAISTTEDLFAKLVVKP
jgi:hypothetical protein